MRITTVDLAQTGTPSAYYGKRAVWTAYDGTQHTGVVEPDPMGSWAPVVRFEDGSYGRTGGVLALVDDESTPRTATATVTGGLGVGYLVSSPDLDEIALSALTDALEAYGIGSPKVQRYMRIFYGMSVDLVTEGIR